MANGTNKAIRNRVVWEKTNGRCAHCGKVVAKNEQTVDHFIPRSNGGGFDRRNLMPLCKKCNMHRNNVPVDPYEFYPYAPAKAIRECLAYKNKWREEHRNLLGEYYK